jgi:hypothetical protein
MGKIGHSTSPTIQIDTEPCEGSLLGSTAPIVQIADAELCKRCLSMHVGFFSKIQARTRPN